MSKNEKEQAIIEAIKKLPKSGFGEYHYYEELQMIIAKVMGYEIIHFPHGRWTVAGFENPEKVRTIIQKMKENGIIKVSKNGNMFCYLGK